MNVCNKCVNLRFSNFHDFHQCPISSYKDLTLSRSIHFSCIDKMLEVEYRRKHSRTNRCFAIFCDYLLKHNKTMRNVHVCFLTCLWLHYKSRIKHDEAIWSFLMFLILDILDVIICYWEIKNTERKITCYFQNTHIKWCQMDYLVSAFTWKWQSNTELYRHHQTSTDTVQQQCIAYNQKDTARICQDHPGSARCQC